jgi:hypothetical protein
MGYDVLNPQGFKNLAGFNYSTFLPMPSLQAMASM